MRQNYYITYSYANDHGGITRGNQFIGVEARLSADLLGMQTLIDITKFLSKKYANGKDESVLIDSIFRIADGELEGSDYAAYLPNITQ